MGDCKLSQYGAVCRTLAKMCKLDGSCPEECAQADMINECAKDVLDGTLSGALSKVVAHL